MRWPPRDEGAASTVRCSGLAGVTAGEPHPSRSLTGANDTDRRPARITRDRGAERVPGTTVRRMPTRQRPDRNLALELVRTTEAAALAGSRWMGRGDKNGADGAAVEAMRTVLATVPMDGVVVIGEGEKDEAPMLFNGEKVGDGTSPLCDVAVDPIDGTTLTALGRGNALVRDRGERARHHVQPRPLRLHGEDRGRTRTPSGSIDITASPTQNLRWVAKAKGESVRDLTVVILDRDRHHDLIDEVRSTGARIRLISDGDIYGAIATSSPGAGADVLFGIGGTPEGVVAAAALKCMGGEIQGRLWPRNDAERDQAVEAGYDLSAILTTDDLVQGDNCFFAATGITDGELLQGVRFEPGGASTQSLVMRSTVGHGPPHHRPAPARQAAGLRGRRLRLSLRRRSPLRFDGSYSLRSAMPRYAVAVRRPSRTHRALAASLRQRRARTDVGQRPPQARAVGRRRPRRSRPWTRRPTPPASAGGSRTPGRSAPRSARGR